MEINGWIRQGVKESIGPIRGNRDPTELRAVVRAVRGDGDGATVAADDGRVVWQQDRVSVGVRAAARIVLGLGSTVLVFLLVALVVVGPDTRSTLLVVAGLLMVFGGGFVWIVWHIDVGIVIQANGRVVRSGWGGIREYDLHSYGRVTVRVFKKGGVDGGTADGF
ncbi:MAG: hypothetical protein AAGC53_14890 [Actinomycetota bacterium]